MTVAELIRELLKHNGDLTVTIVLPAYAVAVPVTAVKVASDGNVEIEGD